MYLNVYNINKSHWSSLTNPTTITRSRYLCVCVCTVLCPSLYIYIYKNTFMCSYIFRISFSILQSHSLYSTRSSISHNNSKKSICIVFEYIYKYVISCIDGDGTWLLYKTVTHSLTHPLSLSLSLSVCHTLCIISPNFPIFHIWTINHLCFVCVSVMCSPFVCSVRVRVCVFLCSVFCPTQ